MTPLKDPTLRPIDPSIACIGAGYGGKNRIRNFHAIGALSAVCETSPERRAGLAAQYPSVHVTPAIDELLADPEVAGVTITPTGSTWARSAGRRTSCGPSPPMTYRSSSDQVRGRLWG